MVSLISNKEQALKDHIRKRISELREDLVIRTCLLIAILFTIGYGVYSIDKAKLDYCLSCGFEPDRCNQFSWCNGYCFCGYNANEGVNYTFVGIVSFVVLFLSLSTWKLFFRDIVVSLRNLKMLL